MIDVGNYWGIENEIRITCIDGQQIVGKIDNIDDEEESGFGEVGISMTTRDGRFVGVRQSEIENIEIL